MSLIFHIQLTQNEDKKNLKYLYKRQADLYNSDS